jgi:hypothetical protein
VAVFAAGDAVGLHGEWFGIRDGGLLFNNLPDNSPASCFQV